MKMKGKIKERKKIHKGNRNSPEIDLKEKQASASQSARFIHCFLYVSELFQICFRTVSVSFLFTFSFISIVRTPLRLGEASKCMCALLKCVPDR